jgi:peptidoglycan/xylan/chitin deacetylase (PgdA/CDA1 family)
MAFPILRRLGLPATVFVVGETLSLERRTVDWTTTRPPGPLGTLRPEQIREMRASGITFGSHGHTHRDLTDLSPEECERELRDSRVTLEEVLDAPVRVLAYPFGRHNAAVRQAAHRAGYSHALGTADGMEPVGPYGIPRAAVYPADGGVSLALRLKVSPWYLSIRRSPLFPLLRRLGGQGKRRSEEASAADAV